MGGLAPIADNAKYNARRKQFGSAVKGDVKTYCPIPQQPTICAAILSSFTAEGLTRQEALTQPRRAEVILRHDPLAASPYIVSLFSPAFAFDGCGPPIRKDQAWDFATFEEARSWFDGLFDANADMIVERKQPPKHERENRTFSWKVGDAETLSRLIPYDTWFARTQAKLDEVAADSQTAASTEPYKCADPLPKKRSHKCCNRRASRRRGTVAPPTPRRYGIVPRLPPIYEMAWKCESFFSFGNC